MAVETGLIVAESGDTKLIRTICNTATVAAIMYIIGLAGASDTGVISFKQLLIRGTISLIVLVAATVIKEKECTADQA